MAGLRWQGRSRFLHSVAARTAGDPDAMAEAVREAIWAVDREQPSG
jgi:hypothetical protein